MPWTETTRRQYARDGLRYASDLTDAEWALVEPRLPQPRRLGCPRTTDLRAVMDAILYLASAGCAWRLLPKDFPPLSTVQGYFRDWRDRGLLRAINDDGVMEAREGGSGGQSERRHHRQPERQDHRKRRNPWLRRRQEAERLEVERGVKAGVTTVHEFFAKRGIT